MRSCVLVIALMVATPGAACGQANTDPPPLPSVTLPPELDRVLRDYEIAWRASDANGLAALFADGRVVMTNSGQAVRGREAVRQMYSRGGGPLVLRAMSYAVDDTVAHIIGGYALRPGEGDAGTFVLALVRSPGGKWLISADMDRARRR
ncbi:MAG TPA: nuclear transport factor 2 family protein [Gemmatimonadaceae bacterium]|nr:nuclear transport factor 2 family protein [Gemmatimonadaceae bacterium]